MMSLWSRQHLLTFILKWLWGVNHVTFTFLPSSNHTSLSLSLTHTHTHTLAYGYSSVRTLEPLNAKYTKPN